MSVRFQAEMAGEGGPEWMRSGGYAAIGLRLKEAVSLGAVGGFLDWFKEDFMGEIGPRVVRAYEAAERMEVETLVALEGEFERVFLGSVIERSVAAAGEVFGLMEGMKRAGALGKYRDRVEAGEIRGQFPVAFAARAAGLHVSVSGALGGYVFQEWLAAGGTREGFESWVGEVAEGIGGLLRGGGEGSVFQVVA